MKKSGVRGPREGGSNLANSPDMIYVFFRFQRLGVFLTQVLFMKLVAAGGVAAATSAAILGRTKFVRD